MASGLFITATGTGVGKTLVTAALTHQIRRAGRPVRALKPVVSGFDMGDCESDPAILLAATGEPLTEGGVEAVSPWRFRAPLSPDMAAAREGKVIDPDGLTRYCRAALSGPEEWVLIEGVGGVMVPLAERFTVAEWMTALALPAVLVAGSYLGTLSHTLSALEVLQNRAVEVKALVISESEESPVPLEETAHSLAPYYGGPVFLLPRVAGPAPWRRLPDLTAIVTAGVS